ncbi:MAG TPA: restriction endonuclease subunit S [Hymenobacter sp.]|uniref:restriction endonuclease subunit S n=1 Tax=Hymenobacter sp. TaxID=1898978 RepID=UPI002D7FD7F7|nr:restriction endonuclease subunit S [Hymenobacter sp.]HET9501892.1 restriction endonuclease subunit S [Hymenobacter sp.]
MAKLEELFSKLDAGVAAVRRTQALLKRYRQSVLHAAVTGELTRAWREAHPPAPAETGAALLQRIRAERRAQWEAAQVAKRGGQLPLGEGWKAKYAEPEAVDTVGLPELPEGWVWATSEQLCSSVASGSTPKPEELFADKGEIPFLKVYNLTKTGHLDFTNKPTFVREQIHNGQLNRSRVNPGDVLINIVGPPLGKVSIVPDEYPEWNINQAIVAFKAVTGYSNKFLLVSLLTETIMNWLLRTAKTTTSQVNLSVTVCRQLPLPLPSEAEQAEIVAEVERRLTVLDALSLTLADELRRAERLRQSILHRAFTGRLVPQEATDEPAAALLARLRDAGAAPAKAKTGRGRKAAPQPKQLSIKL